MARLATADHSVTPELLRASCGRGTLSVSPPRPQPLQALVEVFDQVVHVLQAAVEAEAGAFVRPAGCGADGLRVERDDQALVAAPAGAEAEQAHAVQERRHALMARWLGDEGDEAV